MLGEILNQTRTRSPLVHCMVNLVTANDCANMVLAAGASSIMAEDLEEVSQVAASCDALVLNLGTPGPRKIQALLFAGETARGLKKPVVFDPVGAGCSDLRKDAAQAILTRVRPDIIRGNAGEIRTLLQGGSTHRGVDAETVEEAPLALARALAEKNGAVVVLSGDADIVTDGRTAYRVHNGHPMMRSVTGTGCQMSVLIGAFAAANPDRLLHSALAGVCACGLCGELAHGRLSALDGNASYRNYIIDAVYHLSGETLEEGARYEIL